MCETPPFPNYMGEIKISNSVSAYHLQWHFLTKKTLEMGFIAGNCDPKTAGDVTYRIQKL